MQLNRLDPLLLTKCNIAVFVEKYLIILFSSGGEEELLYEEVEREVEDSGGREDGEDREDGQDEEDGPAGDPTGPPEQTGGGRSKLHRQDTFVLGSPDQPRKCSPRTKVRKVFHQKGKIIQYSLVKSFKIFS